jgi:hypothetical protein
MSAVAVQNSSPAPAVRRLTEEIRLTLRIPYALRRVPEARLAGLLPWAAPPQEGDLALARLEQIGKNTGLELPDGRRCTLHEGDLLAVVFGNRYATEQFEGYAGADGDRCDLLSMGGLCGLAKSKHARIPEPTKLRLLGALGDADGRPLRLREFALAPKTVAGWPRLVVVCGTAMDSGKTHTAMSLVRGLRRQGLRVASIKLTGTACGRDSWSMADAGACPALNFVDGGYASTYLCTLDQLLDLHRLLTAAALAAGAEWVVVEIADGLLQRETAALLQSSRFTQTVDAWVFATGDPLAALGGVGVLRRWGLEPAAISGLIAQSPLAMREAQAATGVPCLTARELQQGALNAQLLDGRCAACHPVRVNAIPANGRAGRTVEA